MVLPLEFCATKASSFPYGGFCFVPWGHGVFVLRHRTVEGHFRHHPLFSTLNLCQSELRNLSINWSQLGLSSDFSSTDAPLSITCEIYEALKCVPLHSYQVIPPGTSQSKSTMSVPSLFQVTQFWLVTGNPLYSSCSHRKKQNPSPAFGRCIYGCGAWNWYNDQAVTG